MLLPMDWQKLWSRSAICVHDETMSCFVAQTMGCSVGGQIEGLICSQTFEGKLASVLGSVGVQKACGVLGV